MRGEGGGKGRGKACNVVTSSTVESDRGERRDHTMMERGCWLFLNPTGPQDVVKLVSVTSSWSGCLDSTSGSLVAVVSDGSVSPTFLQRSNVKHRCYI